MSQDFNQQMLVIADILNNKESVLKGLEKRNFPNAEEKIAELLRLDKTRKEQQANLDSVLAESNRKAREIGNFIKNGQKIEAEELKKETAGLKENASHSKSELYSTQEALTNLLYEIPNVPNSLVPSGTTEDDNEVVLEWGKYPDLNSSALPHWELIQKYDIIDFDLGIKLTGAGYPVYKGKGAKLQRALINFFLDEADKADKADAELDDESDAVSVDEADAQTEVPTAVKIGDETSTDEETSSGKGRTPAVQLSAEDPEADPSS